MMMYSGGNLFCWFVLSVLVFGCIPSMDGYI
jgi:hypothetical protein